MPCREPETMRGLQHTLKTLFAVATALWVGFSPTSRSRAQDPDDVAWSNARATGTVEAFQSYLDTFPTGRHSDAAFGGIVAIARGLPLKDERAVAVGGVARPPAATTRAGAQPARAGALQQGSIRFPGLY